MISAKKIKIYFEINDLRNRIMCSINQGKYGINYAAGSGDGYTFHKASDDWTRFPVACAQTSHYFDNKMEWS